MSPKRIAPQTAAWAKYWSDPSAPHPDAGRAQRSGMAATERVLAPFAKGKVAHYCHHYRQSGEHYHSSFKELEGCEQ